MPAANELAPATKPALGRLCKGFPLLRLQAKRVCLELNREGNEQNFALGYLSRVLMIKMLEFKEKDGKIIILLIGGDKSTQQKDIEKAKEILKKIEKQRYGNYKIRHSRLFR